MVTISNLVLALAAVAQSLAAPTDLAKDSLTDRGPTNFVLQSNSSLSRRSYVNYDQHYTTGGSVNYYSSNSGFQVDWSNAGDFVVGIGWNPGQYSPINYGGEFSVYGGTGFLAVYGWTTNPLVEYYIIESYSNPPTFGQQMGSVTSDGSSYTIWKNTRYNQPSIQGTSTFTQYISVRNSQSTQGRVTVQNHFNAWASLGMNLGNMNFQCMAVEGWDGSGHAALAVNNN